MKRHEEITQPLSCLNKSNDNEMIFVLRAHDIAAPDTIRFWVAERISSGKNDLSDSQIIEALHCADIMEAQRKEGY